MAGKLTINTDTGHYVANAHGLRGYEGVTASLWAQNGAVWFSWGSGTVNNGANIHWEGDLTPTELATINTLINTPGTVFYT